MHEPKVFTATPPFTHGDSPFNRNGQGLSPINLGAANAVPYSPKPALLWRVLPMVYHDQSHELQIIDGQDGGSIQRYLDWELKVPRLNEIHNHLWLAGRPTCARPLHRQAMLGRAVTITEQVDLHMVRQESRIFVKPIPDFLMDVDFWTDYLCKDQDLYECACGFLLSYVWLVCSKSDLKMAQKEGLLDLDVDWDRWRAFTRAILSSLDTTSLEGVNKRYHFGELRLSRLNWIYRFLSKNPSLVRVVRGYMYGYNQSSDLLQRNFAWVFIAFVYISIVLTAMQVGLATDRLRRSVMFQSASYGFTVFAILTPLVIIIIFLLDLVGLSVFNIMATIFLKRRTERDRHSMVSRSQLTA